MSIDGLSHQTIFEAYQTGGRIDLETLSAFFTRCGLDLSSAQIYEILYQLLGIPVSHVKETYFVQLLEHLRNISYEDEMKRLYDTYYLYDIKRLHLFCLRHGVIVSLDELYRRFPAKHIDYGYFAEFYNELKGLPDYIN